MDLVEPLVDLPTSLHAEWPDLKGELETLLTSEEVTEKHVIDWIGDNSYAMPKGIVWLTMLTPKALDELRHDPLLKDILTALYSQEEVVE